MRVLNSSGTSFNLDLTSNSHKLFPRKCATARGELAIRSWELNGLQQVQNQYNIPAESQILCVVLCHLAQKFGKVWFSIF